MSTLMPTANLTQPTVALAMPAFGSKTEEQKYKSKLGGIAIAEVVLGVACVILGAIVTGIIDYNYYRDRNRHVGSSYSLHLTDSYNERYDTIDYPSYSLFSIGEGIWCGVWIIVAGATGIHAAKAKSSRCMVKTHLAFSIVSCAASAVLVIIGGITARWNEFLTKAVVLYFLPVIAGFICFVLNIISACYCFTALGCCMMYQAYGYGEQIIYTQPARAVVETNGIVYTQQYQGVPNVQHGVVGLVQQQPMAQSTTPGSLVFAPPTATDQPNQVSTVTTATAAEPLNGEDFWVGDFPPRYTISI